MLMLEAPTLHFISEDVAFIRYYGKRLPHKQARKMIAAVENFYDRITPTEMTILNMDDNELTHEDLQIIRSLNVEVVG